MYKNGGTWNPANVCLRSMRIRKSLFVSIRCDIRMHDWLVFNVRVIDHHFVEKFKNIEKGNIFLFKVPECRVCKTDVLLFNV